MDPTLAALDEILAKNSVTISANLAERALGIKRGRLSEYADEKPEAISHIPYSPTGTRIKVFRIPFLRLCGCTDDEIAAGKRKPPAEGNS